VAAAPRRGKPARGRDPAPDRAAAIGQYRRRAATYDLELAAFEPLRREAVRRLGLRPGETVLDVACGTGLSFGLLHAALGPQGRIVGVEQSHEMLERARRRVADEGWHHVELIESPVEDFAWRGRADAALLHFTHDVLQQPRAVDRVLAHLRPGARIVATGLKWAPRWALAVNAAVRVAAWRSTTTLAGLDRPWRLLEARIGPMTVEARLVGAVYVAQGVVPSHR
jgi:demethylmenaquinone methyltransferase/2-methoxy-6-polyprenyl-1,4-benzoquinol methylase